MNPRQKFAFFAGILCAVFASLLLILAVFLLSVGDGRSALVFSVISIFPLLIAIACLSPTRRTPALRIVGAITALVMAGLLINSFVNPNKEIDWSSRRLYTIMLTGALAIAIKGRWPSK